MPSVRILHNQTRIEAFSQTLFTRSQHNKQYSQSMKRFDVNKSRHMFTSRHVHVTAHDVNMCHHMLSRYDKPNMRCYAISQRSFEISAACDSLASG